MRKFVLTLVAAAALAVTAPMLASASQLVAGSALKGPADRMLHELGHDVSVVGVARLYRDIAACLVIDRADSNLAVAVEDEGMRCVVTDTIMHGPPEAKALAETVLAAAP